ncbi:unnamed protein product, partial [Gulo gulo]
MHAVVCLLYLLGLNSTNRITGSKYMHLLRHALHKTHQEGCINCTNSVEIPVFPHLC